MPRYASIRHRIAANAALSTESFYNGTPCWIWTGKTSTSRNGFKYPLMTMRVDGKVKNVRVHRLVLKETGYRVTKKTIPMHLCNHTLCVCPDHIRGGSQRMNMRQCVAEGRHNSQRAR
jgi:hypothetical protein